MQFQAFAIRTCAAVTVLAIAQALPQPGSAANRAKVCWSKDMLRAKPGDAAIRKNMRAAYVPVPNYRPRQLAPLPKHLRGVIRRVALPPSDKRVALTFDLCEQPHEISGYQGDIVDYLRSQNIPTTFFAGGKWLLTHRRRAAQLMADERFQIANHSWEHRNHRLIEDAALATAIDGSQAAYELTRKSLKTSACVSPRHQDRASRSPAYLHVPPVQKLFRFPFGACNKKSLDAVNDRGLLVIQWDVSSADPWRGMTASAMIKQVVSRVRPGSIVLFHANGRGWKTGTALPRIVKALRKKGYSFDTVAGLLATRGAQPEIVKTCYDSRPGDTRRYDKLGRNLIRRYNNYYKRFDVNQDASQ
jgi:peptidoglycan-N-acetylglucosamine deacetylase